MRTLLKVTIPVEHGNSSIEQGTLPKTMDTILSDLKPEAAYFTTIDGKRSALVVFDLKDPSQIPSIAEPFFLAFNAQVEFQPVMNVEDLKKAMSGIENTVKKFRIVGGRAA